MSTERNLTFRGEELRPLTVDYWLDELIDVLNNDPSEIPIGLCMRKSTPGIGLQVDKISLNYSTSNTTRLDPPPLVREVI